jgi:hypothetical protein
MTFIMQKYIVLYILFESHDIDNDVSLLFPFRIISLVKGFRVHICFVCVQFILRAWKALLLEDTHQAFRKCPMDVTCFFFLSWMSPVL